MVEAVQAFVPIHVDWEEHPRVADAFNVSYIPDVRFLAPDGKEAARLKMRKPGAPWDTAAVLAQIQEVAARFK